MTPKLIVAVLAITAIPVCAQAQDASAPVAAAQRVVKIISSDPSIAIYCDIGKLGEQIEDANEKKDRKAADLLTLKMRELEKQLDPEYVSLIGGLQDVDPESDDGVEMEATLRPLDKACAKE
jgi:hypothetical protein